MPGMKDSINTLYLLKTSTPPTEQPRQRRASLGSRNDGTTSGSTLFAGGKKELHQVARL